MSTCIERFNNTLITGSDLTWGRLDRTTLLNQTYRSYLRPDVGGALFPWAYTIAFFIIHVPVVIIRVARFDLVQYFCIGSAILAVYLAFQEYFSTGYVPSKVLTWNPLLLVIDAGAMIQVFFLVIEARAVKVGNRTIVMEPDEAPKEGILPQGEPLAKSILSKASTFRKRVEASLKNRKNPQSYDRVIEMRNQDDNAEIQQVHHDTPSSLPAILAATLSLVIFIIIVVFQILGLQASFDAHNMSTPPSVSWCSPAFQPFGIVVMDGDCNIYEVDRRSQQGIGCINLPGHWQQDWLYISGVGTTICLALEFIDILILASVNGSSKIFHQVKMKRPWATMICGLVVLGITLVYGIEYSQILPLGITERVIVVANVGRLMAFEATLVTAGLRGSLIGWSDGLFKSWGKAYFGS